MKNIYLLIDVQRAKLYRKLFFDLPNGHNIETPREWIHNWRQGDGYTQEDVGEDAQIDDLLLASYLKSLLA